MTPLGRQSTHFRQGMEPTSNMGNLFHGIVTMVTVGLQISPKALQHFGGDLARTSLDIMVQNKLLFFLLAGAEHPRPGLLLRLTVILLQHLKLGFVPVDNIAAKQLFV